MTTLFPARIARLFTAVLASGFLATAAQAAAPLVFNTTPPTNDLQGSFAAQVLFAQSQIFPARPREGDNQPYLVSQRRSLLMVRPLKPDGTTPMAVTARDAAGKTLGTLNLNPPAKLPRTAYHVDGVPEDGVVFTPGNGSTQTINNRTDLDKLTDPSGAFLLGRLRQHALVEIQTADGQWVREIHLPKDAALEGKMVRTRSSAGYQSSIHYGVRQAALAREQTLQFKFVRGQWVREGELENNGLTYATDAWSAVLPAEWIAPGLTLQLRQGNLTGELTGLKVGAPSELLIHTIDVGMLTTPRDSFAFAKDPEAHREYFQTVPTSRLIITRYAPLSLTEVMLPDGTLLTDKDPSKGGWHEGTMRQHIGKELISHGIDNANYGLNSTAGQGESSHPYVAAQLAAHNNRGKYANGIQVHGGSGGGGIVTLDESLGNELSHEVGHNYGLGHYVGGFKGSVHRSADQINSTWGWDADKNRFVPNFAATRTGKDTTLEGQSQPPFDGRSFGSDAMAGGAPLSSLHRFTLYTPHVAAIIQRFLEGKATFDSASPTGFSKWNAATARMEPYTHKIDLTAQINAPVSDLSEEKFAALFTKYTLVKVAMADGIWTRNIPVPTASAANRGRSLAVEHDAGYGSNLLLNGQQIAVPRGFKKTYTSDGTRWKEEPPADTRNERKPQAFGVPVTTLVGYYDPDAQLKTYIYPALHGAYGFTYPDDTGRLDAQECHLLVETRTGPLRFRLAGHRLADGVMNKFHVNIPAASEPRSVAVVCGGRVLDKKPIAPVAEKLTFTVNGRPLAPPAPARAQRPVGEPTSTNAKPASPAP